MSEELDSIIESAYSEYRRAYSPTEDITGCVYPRDKFDSSSAFVAFKVQEHLNTRQLDKELVDALAGIIEIIKTVPPNHMTANMCNIHRLAYIALAKHKENK